VTIKLNRKQKREQAKRLAKRLVSQGPKQSPADRRVAEVEVQLQRAVGINKALTDAITWTEQCNTDSEDNDSVDALATEWRKNLDDNTVDIVLLYKELFAALEIGEAETATELFLPPTEEDVAEAN
jgi:alcohol dehydrogenase class IV